MNQIEIDQLVAATNAPRFWVTERINFQEHEIARMDRCIARLEAVGKTDEIMAELESCELAAAFMRAIKGLCDD